MTGGCSRSSKVSGMASASRSSTSWSWRRIASAYAMRPISVTRRTASASTGGRSGSGLACTAGGAARRADVDGQPEGDHRRLHRALTQRGVGMDGVGDVLQGGFKLQGEHGLGDQVAGAGPDDMHTEDLAVLLIGDDF